MNVATSIDKEVLGQFAAESINKIQDTNAPNGKRWVNAIAKAVVEIESNPYLTYDLKSHELMMLSERTGTVYRANGTCQCQAYEQGFPRYHRAASRLVAVYLERTKQ
jgi:hypothetical protein